MPWPDPTRFFDRYDLLARIVPGLLPALVPGGAVLVSNPALRPHGAVQWTGSTIIVIAILWLLASWARSRGRAVQAQLIDEWGGLPTEILLRHSDPTIEGPTKKRYHAALATMVPGLTMPNAETEVADPTGADSAYRSSVRRLIEARRGPKYSLILGENIAYGFWRNLLGMKLPAITITLIALAIILAPGLIPIISRGAGTDYQEILSPERLVGVAVDVAWLAFLSLAVTRRQVWDAGVTYAERLFGSLDAKGR